MSHDPNQEVEEDEDRERMRKKVTRRRAQESSWNAI
jgi:hypothetical protein